MARVKIPYWTIPVPDSVVQAFDWIWRAISEIAEKYTVYDEVGVFEKNQSVEEVELEWATSVTIDASLSNCFRITLLGNTTFETPINTTPGTVINLAVMQDGTGSRTATFSDGWDFGWKGAPTLSTAASEVDFFSAYYTALHSKLITIFWKGSA